MFRLLSQCWILGIVIASVLSPDSSRAAENWPMFRGNAQRTGYTTNAAPTELEMKWELVPAHQPNPAFPSQPRQHYDIAFHPVIADGLVFFGSSADNKIYALDANSGEEVWTFMTGGPIRTAPAIWKDRLFVGSDDGLLYCFDKATGKVQWTHRARGADKMIMGNDRMISHWPVRGGPAVVDGIVYFGAGLWPTEGVSIRALDARTGEIIWGNEDSGTWQHRTPRAGNPKSGLASQGHLAVGNGIVVVPTGRACPAVLNSKDGSLRYFHHGLHANKAIGGTKAGIFDKMVVYGENYPIDRNSKTRVCTLEEGDVFQIRTSPVYAHHPDMFVMVSGDEIAGYDRTISSEERKDRDGKSYTVKRTFLTSKWKCDAPFDVTTLIIAGNTVVLGGNKEIALIDINTSQVLAWAKTDSDVLSLAVANGCVYATTRLGTIFCFGQEGQGKTITQTKEKITPGTGFYADAAEEIIGKTKVTEGYCLDIGCGTGQLIQELAARSKLHIIGVDTDREKVKQACARFDRLGLQGVRVTIMHVDDLNKLPFSGRFAELLVSCKGLKEGDDWLEASTIKKMICPLLGTTCVGEKGKLTPVRAEKIRGSGNWTHFYADAGNTHCGTDTAVHGPLELLWFRDTDYTMANRHSMSSPTMVYEGYMVMPGEHGIRVANMYNGRPLWQHDIPGLNFYPGGFSYDRRKLTGNMCVADGKVFVRHQDYCRSFDIRTGKMLSEWKVPKVHSSSDDHRWGFIASHDGTLFGSIANSKLAVKGYPGPGSDQHERLLKLLEENPALNPNHHYPDSHLLFAMDAETGKVKWTYRAKHSIRSSAIAVGKDKIFFVDKPASPYDDYLNYLANRGKMDEEKLRRRGGEIAEKTGTTLEHQLQRFKDPRGPLVALDAKTGKVTWKTDDESGFGTILAVSSEQDALVMIGPKTAVYQASSGKVLWKGNALSRPMIFGRELRSGTTIYDIATGERTGRIPGLGGYCAPTLGSPRLLACRSGVIGYKDISDLDGETQFFGGIRPGCYLDMTPAGGLLVMSDGAAGCGCSYINQCTIALQPVPSLDQSQPTRPAQKNFQQE